MFSHPAASAAAHAAANRAQLKMRRLLDLLSAETGTVSYREVQEALVQSILANVAFTDAVRSAMRHAAPAGKMSSDC